MLNRSRALSKVRLVFLILVVIIIVSAGTFAAYTSFIQSKTSSLATTTCAENCYVLSFNQTSICAADTALGGDYFAPWSVTLTSDTNNENITKVQPPGSPPPAFDVVVSGSSQNKQFSSINFTVPSGNYSYTINPRDFVVNRTSPSPNFGTITINGHNAVVNVSFIPGSCGYLISSNVTCAIQRVSVYSVIVITTRDNSTYSFGSTTEETYNITTFATSTSLTEPYPYATTTTLSNPSTETITGAITSWTAKSCTWLYP